MENLHDLIGGANGRLNGKIAKPKRISTKPVSQVNRYRYWLTIALGCGIPLFCLSLSHLGGTMLGQGFFALGVVALILCGAVLGVSLSHLAWAVKDITRSARWQSICLAVAVDLAIVLLELVGVAKVEGVEALRIAVMLVVTGASMALNVWAFIRHR